MTRSYNYRKSPQKPAKGRHILTIFVVLVFAGAGIGTFIVQGHSRNVEKSKQAAAAQKSPSNINLNPPTTAEKQAANDQKQAIVTKESAGKTAETPRTADNKRVVKPVIVSVVDSEVRGSVPGIVEDNGTCTATFTKSGAATVTLTSTGIANAQDTICVPINYSGTAVSSGWNVVLSYQSSSASGTSSPTTVQ